MSQVVYCELGSHDLQVVPKACLVPIDNYAQVERMWASERFDLIDVGQRGLHDYDVR